MLLCLPSLAFRTGANAGIAKDRSEIRAFRMEHARQTTGLFRCMPWFDVDHILALRAGSVDKRINMQWLAKMTTGSRRWWMCGSAGATGKA